MHFCFGRLTAADHRAPTFKKTCITYITENNGTNYTQSRKILKNTKLKIKITTYALPNANITVT